MTDVVLTLNAGSSSIKFAAFEAGSAGLPLLASGQVEGLYGAAKFSARKAEGEPVTHAIPGGADHKSALAEVLSWLERSVQDCRVVAVGHRIVHGGTEFTEPTLIDAAKLESMKRLIPLAPLHQPHNIAGVEAALAAFPSAVQVGCFDTSFHRSHPLVADIFGLPKSFYEEGVRRYGFHGLSYEYISRRLAEIAPGLAAGRVVVAHLGNGASLCALRNGRSIDSTMSLTALDGLLMGTRCGQIDPGVLLYLMTEKRMSADQISDLLYNHSGLKGMSGISNDMRELESSSAPAAREALDYFIYRLRREIGSLAAALGGLDALVFTAGIGEHSAHVREETLAGLEWLGVSVDPAANTANAQIISAPGSKVTVFVIPTNEERMIAEHTAAIHRRSDQTPSVSSPRTRGSSV